MQAVKCFFLRGNEWSRRYREINQHPSLLWNCITHGFLDPSAFPEISVNFSQFQSILVNFSRFSLILVASLNFSQFQSIFSQFQSVSVSFSQFQSVLVGFKQQKCKNFLPTGRWGETTLPTEPLEKNCNCNRNIRGFQGRTAPITTSQ